jgi:type IV pilus assembly protein PilV
MSLSIGGRYCALRSKRSRGFSLVEVLVALVVVSVGLLGLAKMESLAVSSTTVAGVRSIVAGQAANLAAMMHANQDFWQNPIVYTSKTITSTAIPTATACTTSGTTACGPQAMADYDLSVWATALKQVVPYNSTTITCNVPLGTATPASCAIQITWFDNAVAMTTQQANATTGVTAVSARPTYYTLYVQP